MENMAKLVTFTGRVQGVGFRFTAFHAANRCQLTGYVRNMSDGSVEMLAQGTAENISTCIRDIQDSFPGYVRETKIQSAEFDTGYSEFKITF